MEWSFQQHYSVQGYRPSNCSNACLTPSPARTIADTIPLKLSCLI